MLDEIMGWSAIYLLGRITVTQSMTLEFKRPVQVEQPLTVIGATGEVIGRRIALTGEIRDADNALCARAEGIFTDIPPRTAVRMGVMSSSCLERFLPILRQREEARPA